MIPGMQPERETCLLEFSAWIGYKEMPGYERTLGFALSIGVGLIGVALIGTGLWLVLPGRNNEKSNVSGE